MRHFEGEFIGVDNTNLYYQAWIPDNEPKAVIILLHGFASHSGRLINVVNALVPLNYIIFANDHRGHGKSGGKTNFVKSIDQYVEDERIFYDVVKEKSPNLPIFMLGHSMGAGITFYFAQKYENLLKGIIISGVGTKYGGDDISEKIKSLAKKISKFAPKFSVNTGLNPNLLSHDTEVVRAYKEDPLVHYKKTTVGQANAMFESFNKLPNIVGDIHCPILIQKGLADATVTGYDEMKIALKSENITIQEYEGLYHEIYNESEKDRQHVLKDLSNWLSSHL